jgi:hypothetical protein
MRILENIKEKKVSRKNFIFYSGVVIAGVFMLIKQPFKLLRKKEEERISAKNKNVIRFEMNPDSVKRS